MSLLSSLSTVTHAAAGLAAGLEPIFTAAGGAVGKAAVAARKPAGTTRTATAKVSTAKKTSAPKTTTVAKSVKATSGYAKTAAGDDFAFLKDTTLSVEEKLFRFMCAVAKRNDDEVLKKMEEMKGGSAKAGNASSGGSSTPKKSSGFSIWSALKTVLPPLGLASKVLGDAKLKSMITQVSGPVLAAAVTALGMPALAPLALKAGPGLTSSLLDGKLTGDEAAAVTGGSSSGTSSADSSSTSSSTAANGKNEQVQMMELQRLVDKQKEMFAMISNVLRAQHDTRMSIIGNVR